MLHMPTPMLMGGGGPAPKTYAQWVAHLATVSQGGSQQQDPTSSVGPGVYRITLFNGGGGMYGSPWQGHFVSATFSRVLQHGMPNDGTTWASQATGGGRDVLVSLNNGPYTADYTPRFRNGFASADYDPAWGEMTSHVCNRVAWFDTTTGFAWETNPQAGTGPIPYTATGW